MRGCRSGVQCNATMCSQDGQRVEAGQCRRSTRPPSEAAAGAHCASHWTPPQGGVLQRRPSDCPVTGCQ